MTENVKRTKLQEVFTRKLDTIIELQKIANKISERKWKDIEKLKQETMKEVVKSPEWIKMANHLSEAMISYRKITRMFKKMGGEVNENK